ncbi:ATP-dependent acyl-CoA ligase [Mycolicibacterium moriokaense]|uniref:ATP-dependent acyl-CoA ligase n=1 Tax=Mycolicibacterium moriokaense TaxID=39691 RepID=A0AAD1HBJ6_9MYCO|nr:AMP-binding protein [Mycolicibacterium moriokaense]MCV7038569.1 AMP-binding protein [Mycolicibacterium moriokaense]ORB24780.1 ATP-dependent acyl-CoA ligase [Mycolicibacterium moriokaense]BBX02307.1 ATP-dependent acyl-CoA ligase [Mycolicibacterium moriokaense]
MGRGREPVPDPAAFGVDGFSVPAVLDRRAEQYGERVMMSIAGTPVTFAQMRDRSCAAAHILAGLGVKRGDTVALFTATCPEWVYFWLGAARIGAVSAAVNAANKGEFLAHALNLSRAAVVLTDAERRPRVDEIAGDVPTLRSTLVVDHSLTEALTAASVTTPDVEPVGPGDIGALFFTSGTTGPSKAVATTWHYLYTAAATVARSWELQPGETLWTAMPLFHLSAAPTVLAPMLTGATSVLAAAFHPGQVWDEIRDSGAVGFAGAGAMVSMLMRLPPDRRDSELGIRFISAAPIAADMYRAIEERYRCRIVTMYGLTEAFPIAYKSVSDEGKPGTSGVVNPAYDVRIVDGQGRPLRTGTVGEIACRARTAHGISEGYVSSASGGASLEVQPHPEWFRTGDLGSLDDDGNLTFVDRAKDSLRRRGENVSSVEVEQIVMRHPAVLEAAAVGIPSDLGEDDILVVVTLQDGATVDFTEVLDFCSARMPYFCVPRYLEVIDEIPKNIIGRVRKDVLRSRGLGADAWDREAHGYVLSR